MTLLLTSGCTFPLFDSEGQGAVPITSAHTPRVVVAMVDTGIQPYHDAFRLPPGMDTTWIRALPGVSVVPASFEAHALEPSEWEFERGVLYWFEGTRVLAVSPDEFTPTLASQEHRVFDDAGHGTLTASIVAAVAPGAFIVMVEAITLKGTYEWIRTQPWIDVVTTSANSPPLPWSAGERAAPGVFNPGPIPEILQEIVRQGRPVVAAAGNDPLPATHTEAGPPWVITVGGAHEEARGSSPASRVPPDVVAEYRHDGLASATDLHGYVAASGTSFSAPMVAAVIAESVFRLRSSAGWEGGLRDGVLLDVGKRGLTQADFRAALNVSAVYWSTTDYSPALPGSVQSEGLGNLSVPVLPATPGVHAGPWVQMGWGFVGNDSVEAIVALLQGASPPTKPAEAMEYMAEVYAMRQTYWALPPAG